jgi:hypothetical protein
MSDCVRVAGRARRGLKMIFALALLATAGAQTAAQEKYEFWPGASYDARVPTFRDVLGYEPGERITSHAGLMKYLEALAAAAPARMKVFEYARSWEGRRLVYAAVGSEENIGRLDAVRAGVQRLADPRRTTEAEARSLVQTLPAVIWLGYGVHGNEISSPDAALLTAYHLLAARNDPLVESVLSKTVVLIDPTQNPDGRDRFVHNFEIAEGIEPDGSPVAAERNEPWPGGRTNHYYFDMNRDWFALTQPETRGRVRMMLEWYPLVVVDLHEMGSDSHYFFSPDAPAFNPHLARDQRESQKLFGRNNARWFDRFGFSYFTGEVYDAFYPGYGASWPSYYGSVAMTYEQASARGLAARRSDDTTLRFRDSVRHHFVASLATAEAAAQNREKLLEDFYRYRRTAVEEGQAERVKAYILPRRGDTSAVDKLAAVLAEQGVEVKRAAAAFRACGGEHPAGSYVVELAQPSKRLIRTLLDADVQMEAEFVKEQERLRKKRLPDQIYDVTAWSLPLNYNVESVACGEPLRVGLEAVVRPQMIQPGRVAGGQASVAYLAPWGTAAAGRLLAASLREGLRVHSTDKPFTQQGRGYPSGTLIFKVKENRADLRQTLDRLAAATGADLYATDTGWVEEGVNFGSNNVVYMRRPRVALAWDTPTASNSAGAARFVLERQFGYPVTAVRTRQLTGADLARFDVVILPDAGGDYASTFGAEGIRRLKDWVAAGGTVIGIGGGGVAFLSDQRVGLLAVSQENRAGGGTARGGEGAREPEAGAGQESRPAQVSGGRVAGRLLATEDDYNKAIQADGELPDSLAGVLVRARLDPDHWITAGMTGTVNALVEGRAIFTPIKLDRGVNAALFLGPSENLAGGYVWEENRKQLAFKPFVVVQPQGRGVVVGFTADPNFRAYMDGLNVLFLNAVFRGAAHARPAVSE